MSAKTVTAHTPGPRRVDLATLVHREAVALRTAALNFSTVAKGAVHGMNDPAGVAANKKLLAAALEYAAAIAKAEGRP